MTEKRVVYCLPAILVFSVLAVLPSDALSEGSRKNLKALAREGRLSSSFEPNLGQADPDVKFLSRGRGYTLFLTSAEVVLSLASPSGTEDSPESKIGDPKSTALRIKLLGGNIDSSIVGVDQLPGRSNYFLGANPEKWRTSIPHYSGVKYHNLYPGVDLLFYGNGRNLEYDFVVAPGADPYMIKLAIEGAETIHIEPEGDVVFRLPGGEVRMRKPVVYQEVNGVREQLSARYVISQKERSKSEISDSKINERTIENPKPILSLSTESILREVEGLRRDSAEASKIQNRTIGFQIAGYDASRPLIIDPVLTYSTYVGGIAADLGSSIALDAAGNIYVTGQTESPNFPTANAIQPANSGSSDAFVLKLDPTGTTLLYSTYLGGSLADRGNGIAVDGEGNAYITGRAGSLDFPVTPGAFQIGFRGGMFDAFVAKLSSDGSALLYSTYLGGFGNDAGFGIAVDSAGNAYATGGTRSDDFPVTAAAFQPSLSGSLDAYVAKLDPTGSGLIYSTYLGGSGNDRANGLAVDSGGNAYISGHTDSIDFPTANAFQANNAGGRDVFVTKLNAGGDALLYSTYLGGNSEDSGMGIAVDVLGNAYVTGYSDSTNFPTANAFQPANGGFRDAFVTKFNAEGNGLVYSTYLGGSGSENLVAEQGEGATVGAIAVDASAVAYVTGVTRSTDFPTANAVQPAFGGGVDDAFVAKVSADGSALIYSTYLGGSASDIGVGIAVDGSGTAYVTGETRSANFPTANAFQPGLAGSSDVFIAVISDATGGATALSVSPASVVPGDTITVSWTGIPSPTANDWIGLYLQGTDDSQFIDWIYVSCSQTPAAAQANGTCPFVVPATLPEGTYEMRLFASGFVRLATSNPFVVVGGGMITTLSADRTEVVPGDTITISWTGISSPAPDDWIGLYLQGTDDSQFIDWIYVSCSQTPVAAQANGTCPFVVPAALAEGTYEMRLFATGFLRLATSNLLTVQGQFANVWR